MAKRIKPYLDTHHQELKNDQAILQFNLSLDPDEINNTSFLWNDYAIVSS